MNAPAGKTGRKRFQMKYAAATMMRKKGHRLLALMRPHRAKGKAAMVVPIMVLLALLIACSAAATATPQPTATRVPAATALATATTAPTATPAPAATAAPRAAPTATPNPTPTNEQGVTRESIGRGAGNVKGIVSIEAGKTDLRVVRLTFAPSGYISWHYHNGPALVVVEKGTVTIKHADGATEDYPAGSAFFEPKGNVHRSSNNGNVDAVGFTIFAIAGGPPAETPPTVFVPDPTIK